MNGSRVERRSGWGVIGFDSDPNYSKVLRHEAVFCVLFECVLQCEAEKEDINSQQ